MKRVIIIAALTLCAVLTLLGCLWTTQGLGLVTIDPIACVGECTPVHGPNTTWTITGVLTVATGATGSAALARMLRRNGRHR